MRLQNHLDLLHLLHYDIYLSLNLSNNLQNLYLN
nr:MAG TPA: hypothetical protein [Crassvirales sp.]